MSSKKKKLLEKVVLEVKLTLHHYECVRNSVVIHRVHYNCS
jgi:hypothetical protein